ncbi:metal-dependent hydrolase [Candidatus Kaiserbacteria bacterium]|nr:metal-dependent hydrolase [Candidatus Kaiserbacteria bacterium]
MKLLLQLPSLFADWANGIFAVLIVSWFIGIEPTWWYFLIGILLSHSPDLDALPELLRRGKVAASAEHPEDHRSLLHYPIPVLMLLAFLIPVDPYWGSVWCVAVLLHYLNDFYGTGWGLQLLWPFSTKNYKLLGRRVNRLEYILRKQGDWEQLSEEERRLRYVVSWNQAELPQYILRWGIDDWVRPYYWNVNWISVIEYGLFILAIILMVLSLV